MVLCICGVTQTRGLQMKISMTLIIVLLLSSCNGTKHTCRAVPHEQKLEFVKVCLEGPRENSIFSCTTEFKELYCRKLESRD